MDFTQIESSPFHFFSTYNQEKGVARKKRNEKVWYISCWCGVELEQLQTVCANATLPNKYTAES